MQIRPAPEAEFFPLAHVGKGGGVVSLHTSGPASTMCIFLIQQKLPLGKNHVRFGHPDNLSAKYNARVFRGTWRTKPHPDGVVKGG